MEIQPKTLEEAREIVFDILNQGDSRYNDPKNEDIIAKAMLENWVKLEKLDFPTIPSPNQITMEGIKGVQKLDKYTSRFLLEEQGFNTNEIFFEVSFRGFKPDVFAQNKDKLILVECCSCRTNKILDYLQEADEVWIITLGSAPWETKPIFKKSEWFIFTKGKNWQNYLKFQEQNLLELRKIISPLDKLMQ